MTSLSGKQKRYLRGLGQRLDAVCTVGKAGATDEIVRNIGQLLVERELVKIRLTSEHGRERKITAARLAEATESNCAGVVGRTVLLYRPNEKLPPEKRICLDG
jgi:RNA-binding protein